MVNYEFTNESMAMYEAVVKYESGNPIFETNEEINEVLKSLVLKGILEDKVGIVNDKEMEYLIKFGHIQSKNKRVLTFVRNDLNEKMKQTRLKLEKEIFWPR
jgi:hypothetical protein